MSLNTKQLKERSEYLENNLIVTECSQRKPYAFISYASDNWETVFKTVIVNFQRDHGLHIYADKAFDKVNDKWIVPMLRNVRGSELVIAFVSQKYIESYACFLELLTAVTNKKPIVFVSLEQELNLGDTTDQPNIERGAKTEILNQGSTLSTNTNNTSNDIMRAMKAAYSSLSTLLEQDAVSKYDISDAFINFFRDASVNRKSINDLNALYETINSVSSRVFDIDDIALHNINSSNAINRSVTNSISISLPKDAKNEMPEKTEEIIFNTENDDPKSVITVPMVTKSAISQQNMKKTILFSAIGVAFVALISIFVGISIGNLSDKNNNISINSQYIEDNNEDGIGTKSSIEENTTTTENVNTEITSVSESTATENTSASESITSATTSLTNINDKIINVPNVENKIDEKMIRNYHLITFDNEDIYFGEMSGNKYDGFGMYVNKDGNYIIADWADGNYLNGIFNCNYDDGSSLRGSISNGILDGFCEMVDSNGNIQMVMYKDGNILEYFDDVDKKTLSRENGDIYTGQIKSNEYNGMGFLKISTGIKYYGEFKNDKVDGVGFYDNPNGSKYFGKVKNGNITGYGCFEYFSGDKYYGEWINDKRDGCGYCIHADGTIEAGVWKNDEFRG